MQGKHKIWIGVGLLMIFVTLPVGGQAPPDGEIDYGGTEDGNYSGSATGTFTGSLSDSSLSFATKNVVEVRELTFGARSGGSAFDETVNISSLGLTGDVNPSVSKMFIEVFAFSGSDTPSQTTTFSVSWSIDGVGLAGNTNCSNSATVVEMAVGGLGGEKSGVGQSKLYCELDDYNPNAFDVSSQILTNENTRGERLGFQIWAIQVYNKTVINPLGSATITGDLSGTTTHTEIGAYDGNESGLISLHGNGTGGGVGNNTTVQNLSAENFTFENIMGSLSVEELDFWFPIVFFTIIAWVAFNRDATMIGLSAILGILFVLTGMGAWSIAASLVLMSLGFTLEYLAKRVWRRKRKNME